MRSEKEDGKKENRAAAVQGYDSSNGQPCEEKNGSQSEPCSASASATLESDPDYNMEFVISEAEASLAVREEEAEEEVEEEERQPAGEGCSTGGKGVEPRRHLRSRPSALLEKPVRSQPVKRNRSQALETIFEEPLKKKGKIVLLSKAKSVRRLMIADGGTTSIKKKKLRKKKAKDLRESLKRRKRSRDQMER